MQEFHFAVEMDHEGFILVRAQHVVEEAVAGRALLVKNAPLAHAGIDQQAERQWKVGISRENK